jgi:type I restriction-modification system DNA methylase subunit
MVLPVIQTTLNPIRNNNLFSQYYLDNYLSKSPEWSKTEHVDAFNHIKALFKKENDFLENLNEKQLEDHLFKPLFTVLGFVSEVNEKTTSREFPDFAFFADEKTFAEAHKNKGKIDFYNNAIAIGEVKQWKIDLDKIRKAGSGYTEQPSGQIWHYLSVTAPNWGILTNGRYWRLYCKKRRYDYFFEIDLPDIVARDDVERFRSFYYFFRKDAFVPTKDGPAFLDRILKGSTDYAKAIGTELKDNVYIAMKRIAEGFVERPSNNLDKNDPVTLARIQNNTMILLYRFLFLLFAEGKGLLDLENQRYLTFYSFRHIVLNVAVAADGGPDQQYDQMKTTIQSELKTLFDLINQGSSAFPIFDEGNVKIPAYNGGLFDPKKHPDLEKWEIGDLYLADAIDLLSRSKLEDGHRDRIDYSTLEIRHLGSIYEGLLEYKLKVAQADLVANKSTWVTLEEYNSDKKQKKIFSEFDEINRVKAGHLYLVTDKGERKSSGSYYTPDYIVDYIVRETIGPVVEEKWKEAEDNNLRFIDTTRSINVLDPAMGSGHFLVGAVDFLSQKLLEAVQKDFDAKRIADTAQYTNDWARRDIVSHCIYGVDLNDLAVELAKVGLWLTTISKDKPLSFLDHRLKQGNSLVGARLSELSYYPELEKSKHKIVADQTILKVSPLFIHHLLGKMEELEKTGDDTIADIKRKEKIYEEFKHLPEYEKTKSVANVYVSLFFDNKIDPIIDNSKKFYQSLFRESQYNDENSWKRKSNWKWFTNANNIARIHSFFHWELEFPEIFFESGKVRENPGWDAVIGNPPWEKISATAPDKHYLDVQYQSIREGEINFYNLFISHCYDLSKDNGRIGQIVPNTWLINKTSNLLREFILLHFQIIELHYLCKEVFKDAPDTIPVIFNFIKHKQKSENLKDIHPRVRVVNDQLLEQPTFLVNPIWEDYADQNRWFDRPLHQISVFDTNKNQAVFDRLETNSILINDIGHASDGIYKSTVVKFLKERKDCSSDNPVIESADQLSRYEINWSGAYIPKELWEKHQTLHDGNKIVFHAARKPKLLRRLVAAITDDVVFFSNRFIILKLKKTDYLPFFIISILNSKAMNYYFKHRFPITDIDGYMLHQLPIHRISFTTPADHRSSLFREATHLFQIGVSNKNPQPLLAFVESHLSIKSEESDVIHDVLSYLAERMVEMNKGKNSEIQAFLSFIEGEIGTSVGTMKNKGILQEYYLHDFTKIIEVIVKNKSRIKEGYDPKKPSNYRILQEWHKDSCDKLNPLLERIQSTDDLIDQIVYRLYGLTEEEIRIVEGRS